MASLKYISLILLFSCFIGCSTDSNESQSTEPETSQESENSNEMNSSDQGMENVFEGDIILTNQDEVVTFGSNNYTSITGSIMISYDQNNPSGPEVTSLTPLATIKTIGEDLSVKNHNNLVTLAGLENIENIFGDLTISFNNNLQNIDDLTNANFNKFLFIEYLDVLESLPPFNQITSLDRLRLQSLPIIQELNTLNNVSEITAEILINENDSLESINGFQNLETIDGDFILTDNQSLQTVNGFTTLNAIGRDFFYKGSQITNVNFLQNIQTARHIIINSFGTSNETFDLSGLQNLISCDFIGLANMNITSLESLQNLSEVISLEIANCSNLVSLDGLENLAPKDTNEDNPINQFRVLDNDSLTNFCAATNFITNASVLIYLVQFNGYNPTQDNIIDGDCSN